MRSRQTLAPLADQPRLYLRSEDRHPVLYTDGLVPAAGSVYGERVLAREQHLLRHWDPNRSKLGAALAKGADVPLPAVGSRWLYLGASTGTTASHVADLVGPGGRVAAVERSLRPFARLVRFAERYPNVEPILADARHPEEYAGDVGVADGLYADIAQPDQVEILVANAALFLRPSATVLLALKTASLGREREPKQHLDRARAQLEDAGIEVTGTTSLEPFHKRHFLIAGLPTRALFAGSGTVRPADATPGPAFHAARRR